MHCVSLSYFTKVDVPSGCGVVLSLSLSSQRYSTRQTSQSEPTHVRELPGLQRCMYIHVLMRDEKEGRKKQARSNKQQGKATQHTQGSHFS